MVLLLNILPWAVVPGLLALAYYFKKVRIFCVACAVAVVVLYPKVQPSYMPKGQIVRSEIPAFEKSDAKIENRQLAPKSGKEYDAQREEAIKKGLPFLEQK